MLIPSYPAIQVEFNIPESMLVIPDALFLLVSAFFALIWGYFTDRIDRGKVILFGAFSWTFGMILTSFSPTIEMLIFSRMISGAGLGCVLPVGYSIISDAIPPDERSGWFGTLAVLSSISNGIGQALSSFLGPVTSWRFPFLVLSGISTVIVVFIFFVKIPQRGASEKELTELSELNLEYSYRISKEDLIQILKKKTNRYLISQGFFTIIPGTVLVYFLTSMLALHFFYEIPEIIRIQTATVFAGMVGLGYILGNLLINRVGDVLYRKNKKNRARLATFCMMASIPLALLMFFSLSPVELNVLDVDYPETITAGESILYVVLTVQAVFTKYPNFIIFFMFALIASMLGSAPVANKNAVMVDVNLPEHKGTAASMFNLSEQVGKGITLLLSSLLIQLLGSMFNMMVVSMFFWVPSAIFWLMASRNVGEDIYKKTHVLTERKTMDIIDYIFELEIQIDRAIQKVNDARYYIFSDKAKFTKLINDAIKIFTFCEKEGDFRSITNIQEKARILRIRALMIKQESKRIYKELKKEDNTEEEIESLNQDLDQIRLSISEWEKSTFGKIQTLYEDAYLKVVEARLLRKDQMLISLSKINESINIYERVRYLLNERLQVITAEEEFSAEDKLAYNKERDLYDRCVKALNATIKLKENYELILNQLEEKGISKEDLIKISELTSEYSGDLYKIVVETFAEEGVSTKIQEVLSSAFEQIDELFDKYDEWKEVDFKVF